MCWELVVIECVCCVSVMKIIVRTINRYISGAWWHANILKCILLKFWSRHVTFSLLTSFFIKFWHTPTRRNWQGPEILDIWVDTSGLTFLFFFCINAFNISIIFKFFPLSHSNLLLMIKLFLLNSNINKSRNHFNYHDENINFATMSCITLYNGSNSNNDQGGWYCILCKIKWQSWKCSV